jgi:hypothetical protein
MFSKNPQLLFLSYAYRYECNEVWLLYPNCTEIAENNEKIIDTFVISGANSQEITVKAIDIPFWSVADFGSVEEKLLNLLEKLCS